MKLYDIEVKDNKGESVSLGKYQGKVLLVVNTATKCGLTPQYEGLEELYEKYRDQGFEILDFPCNQFAFQAPGSAEKIDSFCKLRYDTKFPRFAKIKVNGKDADPHSFQARENHYSIRLFRKFPYETPGKGGAS